MQKSGEGETAEKILSGMCRWVADERTMGSCFGGGQQTTNSWWIRGGVAGSEIRRETQWGGRGGGKRRRGFMGVSWKGEDPLATEGRYWDKDQNVFVGRKKIGDPSKGRGAICHLVCR